MIAVIAVGGLIILSILWCIGRCLFCGLSCCCECCYCLKCCGECCGCCSPPRGRAHKYLDEPYMPPNQGYRLEAPMRSGPPPVSSGAGSGFRSEPPQYAEFDSGKKGGNDSLPAMPSWEGAGSKKVLVEEEAVEMDQLKKPENTGPAASVTSNGAPSPTSPSLYGPSSPYGAPSGPPSGPLPGRLGAQSPFGMNRMGQNQSPNPYGMNRMGQNQGPSPYDQPNQPYGANQGYAMGAAGMGAAAMDADRRSPRPYDDGYGHGQSEVGYRGLPGPNGPPTPSGYNNYGRSGPGAQSVSQGYSPEPRGLRSPPNAPGMGGYPDRSERSPGPQGDYGRRTPGTPGYPEGVRRSPGPLSVFPDAARRSPVPPSAPQGHEYGMGGGTGYNRRSPPPNLQFSESPRPLARPPQRQFPDPMAPASPTTLQNNGGFDFSSGYSRPPTRDTNEPTPRPSTASARQEAGDAYPGYKPYQPTNPPRRTEEWTGV